MLREVAAATTWVGVLESDPATPLRSAQDDVVWGRAQDDVVWGCAQDDGRTWVLCVSTTWHDEAAVSLETAATQG